MLLHNMLVGWGKVCYICSYSSDKMGCGACDARHTLSCELHMGRDFSKCSISFVMCATVKCKPLQMSKFGGMMSVSASRWLLL